MLWVKLFKTLKGISPWNISLKYNNSYQRPQCQEHSPFSALLPACFSVFPQAKPSCRRRATFQFPTSTRSTLHVRAETIFGRPTPTAGLTSFRPTRCGWTRWLRLLFTWRLEISLVWGVLTSTRATDSISKVSSTLLKVVENGVMELVLTTLLLQSQGIG